MIQSLRDEVVDRIFARLLGVYGTQFSSKFSRIDNGVDVGLLNAKSVWSEELGGFHDSLESIAWALKHLSPDFAPNAIEFRELCRRAPRKEVRALQYTPTAEDNERHREMAHRAAQAVNAPLPDDLLWARRPKSQKAMDSISDARKQPGQFGALAAIFEQHLADGVCDELGKLLKRWNGLEWEKP